ncbi:hypothetical protein R1flu_011247 [Riccia fluitans]|uniref:Uncharacterized protein n=1 Tax=Riccia fluitans TaxID=41844 RepID=A0ABD1Z7G2_9MARC
MGGGAFKLDYIVLQPEDEQGYEVLIGRPWFYGAGVTEDWNCQEVCFQVEGRRKKVRIPWGPASYHGETPQEDSSELTSTPESAFDSDHSSVGVTQPAIRSEPIVKMEEEKKSASQGCVKKECGRQSLPGKKEKPWQMMKEKGATIVRQKLSEVLNAPLSDKEPTNSEGENVPHREDEMIGATTFRMTEGMILPGSWKEIEVWPGKLYD